MKGQKEVKPIIYVHTRSDYEAQCAMKYDFPTPPSRDCAAARARQRITEVFQPDVGESLLLMSVTESWRMIFDEPELLAFVANACAIKFGYTQEIVDLVKSLRQASHVTAHGYLRSLLNSAP